MQSGRYSSSAFLLTLTRVSCPIITLHSSLNMILFQYASTVLWRLPLHHATRFFLFTARILIAFFTVHLWYPSSWSFLSIVRFEKVRFLPVLNKSVISSALCFKPDILTMSIFFTFASKDQICMFSDRWSSLSPFDTSLFTWGFPKHRRIQCDVYHDLYYHQWLVK